MIPINKALLISNISVFVIVLVVVGGIVGLAYYQQYQEELEAAEQQAQRNQAKSSPPKSTSTPQTSTPRPPSQPSQPSQPIVITASDADYDRLEQILPGNEVIQALPDKAKLGLSFYNFNSGSRAWERDYILTKGSAVQSSDFTDVDMKMIMHSRYVPLLREDNLCDIIQTAQEKGDFATDLMIGKTSLLWKYKSVMGYKDCLGL